MFKNLLHYAQQLKKGDNNYFSSERIYIVSLISFAVIRSINALFFLLSGSGLLLVVHALSALFYIFVLCPLVRKGFRISVLIISLIELNSIVFLTQLGIGHDAGFDSYLFASVTAAFYFSYLTRHKHRQIVPLCLTAMFAVSYFILQQMSYTHEPLFPIPSEYAYFKVILFLFNTLTAFFAMVCFSYLFIWEIQHKSDALEEQNKMLDELAHKDPLTRLLNRRSMNEIVHDRMEELKAHGTLFTMILGDIDDFKKVNDTYGHDAGDLVLKTVADTMRRCVDPEDAICRWGGEEILILITAPEKEALVKAERIRNAIEKSRVVFEDQQIHITMTLGVVEAIPGFKSDALVQQADDKLYYGKKHGKNQVVSVIPE